MNILAEHDSFILSGLEDGVATVLLVHPSEIDDANIKKFGFGKCDLAFQGSAVIICRFDQKTPRIRPSVSTA